jgi:hypothetical protein
VRLKGQTEENDVQYCGDSELTDCMASASRAQERMSSVLVILVTFAEIRCHLFEPSYRVAWVPERVSDWWYHAWPAYVSSLFHVLPAQQHPIQIKVHQPQPPQFLGAPLRGYRCPASDGSECEED